MINPSDLDLKTLPWLPLDDRSAFPERACIYFAIDSLGTVQYVGRTVNARARWGSHHRYEELKAIAGIKIAYLFVELPELLPDIEAALIDYFDPRLNSFLGRPKRTRPVDRVNYKLDSGVRKLLTSLAERKGRNEGSQIERLILQGEAIERLIDKGEALSVSIIEKEINNIWEEVTNNE